MLAVEYWRNGQAICAIGWTGEHFAYQGDRDTATRILSKPLGGTSGHYGLTAKADPVKFLQALHLVYNGGYSSCSEAEPKDVDSQTNWIPITTPEPSPPPKLFWPY